jgi:hypothetical protein
LLAREKRNFHEMRLLRGVYPEELEGLAMTGLGKFPQNTAELLISPNTLGAFNKRAEKSMEKPIVLCICIGIFYLLY